MCSSDIQCEENSMSGDGYKQYGLNITIEKIVILQKYSTEFRLTVRAGSEIYIIQLPVKEIRRTKFLQTIPLSDIDEAELYKQLRQEILGGKFDQARTLYQTNRNGIQRVNNKWMFVCTNGSIDTGGFNPSIYSGIDGYYIPPEAIIDQGEVKIVTKKLFQQYNRNPRVFYALFLLNILGITNGYFRTIGEPEFMKITLWLAGASGSGKTELAKAVGVFIFADKDLNCNVVSATARRNYVLKHLSDSSGSVFFFDDVKKESVRERKNSVRIKIDDILRSVFSGKLTDVIDTQSVPRQIDTCALITGEYMETEESQNARLLYLNVDNFLKGQENSEALRILQKNPLWLTIVCCGYMRWLMIKMEDEDFRSLLTAKLDAMRHDTKRYGDINNAERLCENRRMVEMSYALLEMYFRENGLTEEFIVRCNEVAELSIESLCNNTFSLLGGEQMVVLKSIHNIVKKCKIRKARYQSNMRYADGGCKYRQDYFMLYDFDDILWIDDYAESLLRNTQGQHEQYDGKPCVIIREERLMNLLYEAIKGVLSEYPILCISADEIISHLPKLLKKMQLIYKQHRSDGEWGRTAVKYPVCEIHIEENGKYNIYGACTDTICVVDFRPVVQINIEHPYMEVLMERIEDLTTEKILQDIDGMHDVHKEKIDEAGIYKIRKAFMNGKSLYKA